MARIEPIPWDELPDDARAMLSEGVASGMYTTPVPMQVIAYSSAALRAMHDSYTATFGKGVLEPRLVELVRLRSAQAGACGPCSASRKDDSISEDDVASLGGVDDERFTPREQAAFSYFDLLAEDHHAIDEAFMADLATVFSIAEIVELGYLCSTFLGGHRFMHTLGLLTDEEPVLAYEAGQVDRSLAGQDA